MRRISDDSGHGLGEMFHGLQRYAGGLALLFLTVLSACAPRPGDVPRPETVADPPTQGTPVQALAAPWLAAGDRSGLAPLAQGNEALDARLGLIDAAVSSVDMQVFEMSADPSVRLIVGHLVAAADRGVRVRLLVDDIFTTVRDRDFVRLDGHPNVSVRIFNPLVRGVPKEMGWLLGLPGSNRRMHNKAFVVDNAIAIVGGRNLGDAYFDASEIRQFSDFEVLGAGPMAAVVSASFDAFWNDALALPAASLRPRYAPLAGRVRVRLPDGRVWAGAAGARDGSRALARLTARVAGAATARARVVVDRPEKLRVPRGEGEQRVADALHAALARATEEVILVSPYFVPRDDGAAALAALAARGVDVIVLTNGLAATNQPVVHGGYARHRSALLQAGVRLFEARPDTGPSGQGDASVMRTLHSKLVIIDRREVLVGSMNLDPRSIELNSEIGVFVRLESFAQAVARDVDHMLRHQAYELRLDAAGGIVWEITARDGVRRWRRDPGAGIWRRGIARIVRDLPFVHDQL